MGNKSIIRKDRNVCGSFVRKHRLRLGWTQDKLAIQLQLAGLQLSRIDIAKIEGGWRSLFDYELCAISVALGVELKALAPSGSFLSKKLSEKRPQD